MCGIAGIIHRDPSHAVNEALLHRMCLSLRHRGPDDQGIFRQGAVGLGVRRLSIIDLDTGHQPIPNETGTMAVVLNGEIYNFRHLRRHLEAQGHQFRTQTDTEVIVHLYEEHGVEAVQQLRGEAGENQVAHARLGMTQNIGGSGATIITHIFERVNG